MDLQSVYQSVGSGLGKSTTFVGEMPLIPEVVGKSLDLGLNESAWADGNF